MTRPDRVKRMVEKALDVEIYCDPTANREDKLRLYRIARQKAVVTLLRREQRRVLRLVGKQRDSLNPTLAKQNWGKGYIQANDDLLAALRKGTR